MTISIVIIAVLVLLCVYISLGNYFMCRQRIRKVNCLWGKDFSSYFLLERLGICFLEATLWPYFLWRIRNV